MNQFDDHIGNLSSSAATHAQSTSTASTLSQGTTFCGALAARANTWPTTTSFYPLFKVLENHKLAHGHGGMGEASSRPSQLTRSRKRELDYLLQLCSNVGIIAQETYGNSSNALAQRTLPGFQGGPRMRVSTSTATLEGCMTFWRNSVIGRMLNVVRFELCRGRDHCLSFFHSGSRSPRSH